ncbi:MAG: SDR family NAD(P)-dependent oxidoreductase [Pseudomonadota bacterium]
MSLHDEAILITGGASGLGRAIVERLLAAGARVAVFDRAPPAIDELREANAGAWGEGRLIAHSGDVRSYADNAAAVAACVDTFGRLDCAIANAGIWDFNKPLVDLAPDALDDAFDELFHVNVKGGLLLARAALAALVDSRGSLLFTVSNAGFYSAGGGPLYTATKHAVVGLIRQLAFELGPHVRVNGVAPGAIDTNLRGAAALGQAERVIPGARLQASMPDLSPVGVMPSAHEYAAAYAFFADRENNVPATGVVLNFDGGWGVRGIGQVRQGDALPEKLGIDRD